jgi:hypothetical protein
VHPEERGVQDVLGRVVFADRLVEPLAAVHPEHVAGLHVDLGGDIGVPAVVATICCSVKGFVESRENTTWGTGDGSRAK